MTLCVCGAYVTLWTCAEAERDKLFEGKFVETVSRTLQLAAEGGAPPPPYFSVTAVVDTALSMPSQQETSADQQRISLLVVRTRLEASATGSRGRSACMIGYLQDLVVLQVFLLSTTLGSVCGCVQRQVQAPSAPAVENMYQRMSIAEEHGW